MVTGATGFVGAALVQRLRTEGYIVRSATRTAPVSSDVEYIAVGDTDADTDWKRALAEVDRVVHLAGLVKGDEAELMRVNCDATLALADAAATGNINSLFFFLPLQFTEDLGLATSVRYYRPSQ
mgnify:CR=1 FL=1